MPTKYLDTDELITIVRQYYKKHGYPISAAEAARLLEVHVSIVRTRVYTTKELQFAKSCKGSIIYIGDDNDD